MADSKVPFARSRDIIDAANLPYTPGDLTKWTGAADPGSTAVALDQVASRLTTVETGVPATEVTYTPANGANWVNPDPTLVSGALDDLAGRLTTAETALAYTPNDLNDWNGGVDPGTLVQGVDQLADRVKTAETTISSLDTSRDLQRIINISAGAEAANAIPLTFTVTKGDGSAITLPARLKLSIYSDDVLDAIVAAAAFSLTDGGAGSLLSSAAVNAVYIFETDLSGSLVVDVNDVGGASGLTRYIKVELIHTGVPADTWAATMIRQAVTFDGV